MIDLRQSLSVITALIIPTKSVLLLIMITAIFLNSWKLNKPAQAFLPIFHPNSLQVSILVTVMLYCTKGSHHCTSTSNGLLLASQPTSDPILESLPEVLILRKAGIKTSGRNSRVGGPRKIWVQTESDTGKERHPKKSAVLSPPPEMGNWALMGKSINTPQHYPTWVARELRHFYTNFLESLIESFFQGWLFPGTGGLPCTRAGWPPVLLGIDTGNWKSPRAPWSDGIKGTQVRTGTTSVIHPLKDEVVTYLWFKLNSITQSWLKFCCLLWVLIIYKSWIFHKQFLRLLLHLVCNKL